EPLVRSSSYIPTDQMPTLMADDAGAVEPGPDDFDEELDTSADDVASFLVDGKVKDSKGKSGAPDGLKEGGFKGFRDYLGGLRDKDSGFDEVDVDCKPYDDLDFEDMTLSTDSGAIGMGEVRCTLTIKVPTDYALDLGDTVEAVKTNDKDGDTVKVDTAHPYVLMKTGDSLTAVATDWDVLSARVEWPGRGVGAGSALLRPAADTDQPPQADERQDERDEPVADAEVRPHRRLREVLGVGVAEDADDDAADELDAA